MKHLLRGVCYQVLDCCTKERKGEEIKRNAAHSSAVQIKNGARSEQTV